MDELVWDAEREAWVLASQLADEADVDSLLETVDAVYVWPVGEEA